MNGTKGARVTGFGEVMLRYSPPTGVPLADANRLHVHAGGTEFNVLAAMAKLGSSCQLVTALPDNPLGLSVQRIAAAHGVALKGDLQAPGRLGAYFYEPGAPPRPGVVTYDRTGSAFATYRWGEVDWAEVLAGMKLFFTTGISAAVGEGASDGVRLALQAAARANALVAFDVNYRSMLWTKSEARAAIVPLLEHVDCLFASRSDAIDVLGGPPGSSDKLLAWLADRFALRTAAMVYNPSGQEATGRDPALQWRAAAWHGDQLFTYDQPAPVSTVDRIGAGDAFAAGFLSALLDEEDVPQALRQGSTLMALKNTYAGDFWPGTREELKRLLGGAGGSVHR